MKRRGNGEGHISKLANGKYFAQISVGGDRPTRTFRTQKEAQVWLTEIKDAHNKDRYVNPSLKPLGEYWEEWISVDKATSVSKASRNSYAATRARLPIKLFKTPISQITRQDMQTALNGLQVKRMIGKKEFKACGFRTVQLSRTHLKMCFAQAVEDRLIIENPMNKTVLPARERRKMKAYPHDVENELIEYCGSPPRKNAKGIPWKSDITAQAYKDALLFILRTAVRRSECINLLWSDWEDNKMAIRGTKNDASVASVPLTADVVKMLKRRHSTSNAIYIFEVNGRPLLGGSLYRHVHDRFGRSVHGLRHTLGRDAMEAGINPRIVQEIMRHADIRTTLQTYTEVTDDDKAAAVTKIAGQCNSNATIQQITV